MPSEAVRASFSNLERQHAPPPPASTHPRPRANMPDEIELLGNPQQRAHITDQTSATAPAMSIAEMSLPSGETAAA